MAMITRLVLLSFSVQSLLATNATTPTVNSNVSTSASGSDVAGSTGSIGTVSTVNTEESTPSYPTNPVVYRSMTGVSGSTATELGSTATQQGVTATQPGSTPTEPGSTPTEPGSTLTAMEPTTESGSTTPPNQMSTESGSYAPAGGGTPMEMPRTAGMTSPMTKVMTSVPTSGLVTTLATAMTTEEAPGSAGVGLAVYIAVVSGLVVLVIIFAIAVWCTRRHKSKGARTSGNPFGQDEMDKLDPKDRMSVHRPFSASVAADNALAFVTFNTGAGSAEYHVDGIENPTYALSSVSDEEELMAGGGDHNQNGAATMPSKARLSTTGPPEGAVDAPEGAVEEESEGGKGGNKLMRPVSGVSYTSCDIDVALETLDVGTV